MKNIEKKLTPEQINIYTNLVISVIVISVIVYVSMFLYENFYLVVTQSEEIIILQKKVTTSAINTESFDEIIENLGQKENLKNNFEIKNPFK